MLQVCLAHSLFLSRTLFNISIILTLMIYHQQTLPKATLLELRMGSSLCHKIPLVRTSLRVVVSGVFKYAFTMIFDVLLSVFVAFGVAAPTLQYAATANASEYYDSQPPDILLYAS